MQFPSIPTDNLYKLMAIGGLALSAGTISLAIYLGIFLVNDHTSSLKEYHQRRLELSEREQRLADVEILISTSTADWNESTKSAYQAKVVAAKDIVKYLSEDVSGRAEGLERMRLSMSSNLQTFAKYAGPFAAFMFIVGVAGFILWWSKIQSIQDKILNCEYEKLKLHIAKNT